MRVRQGVKRCNEDRFCAGVQGAKPPEKFCVFVTGNLALSCKVGVQMRVKQGVKSCNEDGK